MATIQCFFVEINADKKWFRPDTGEVFEGRLPAGAMYYADPDWSASIGNPGPDGRHLFVVTPGGTWGVDSDANNCTRPGDKAHHCWVRHGVPPMITVDKNGETCACGHSIGLGKRQDGSWDYHGFLTNGQLIEI